MMFQAYDHKIESNIVTCEGIYICHRADEYDTGQVIMTLDKRLVIHHHYSAFKTIIKHIMIKKYFYNNQNEYD